MTSIEVKVEGLFIALKFSAHSSCFVKVSLWTQQLHFSIQHIVALTANGNLTAILVPKRPGGFSDAFNLQTLRHSSESKVSLWNGQRAVKVPVCRM